MSYAGDTPCYRCGSVRSKRVRIEGNVKCQDQGGCERRRVARREGRSASAPKVYNLAADKCSSIYVVTLGGPIRYRTTRVQCIKGPAHPGDHFASWGGSQAWRQASWSDTTP